MTGYGRTADSPQPARLSRRLPWEGSVTLLAFVIVTLVLIGSLPPATAQATRATPRATVAAAAQSGGAPVGAGSPSLNPVWRPIAAVNSPPARYSFSPASAYDARDGYTLVYGVETYPGGVYYDTWAFLNGSWTNFSSSKGPELLQPAMAYDPVDGYVVLVGGAGPNCPVLCGQAWTWAFAGGKWSELNTTGPSTRVYSTLAWDPALGELILYGGSGTRGALADTWAFLHGEWTELSVTGPPARSCAAMTYVPSAGGLVLFGGLSGPSGGSFAADTWLFDGSWKEHSVTGPSARGCAAFAPEPSAGRGILFGGLGAQPAGSSYRADFGDTWSFDGAAWQDLQLPGPPSRYGAFMTYDAADGYILLVDGIACKNNCSAYSMPNDAWSFSLGKIVPTLMVSVTPTAICIKNEASCPAGTTQAEVNVTLVVGYGEGADAAPAIVAPTLSALPWGEIRVTDANTPVESCVYRGLAGSVCSLGSTPLVIDGSDGFAVNMSADPALQPLFVGNEWSVRFAITVAAPPYGSVPVYSCTTPLCLSEGSGPLLGAFSALTFQPYGVASNQVVSLPFANVTVSQPLGPSTPSTAPGASPPPPPPVPTGVPSPVSVPTPVTVASPVGVVALIVVPTISLASVGAGILGAGFARAVLHRRAIAQGQPVGTVVKPARSTFEPTRRSDYSTREFE